MAEKPNEIGWIGISCDVAAGAANPSSEFDGLEGLLRAVEDLTKKFSRTEESKWQRFWKRLGR